MIFKKFKLRQNIHVFIVLILIAGVPLLLHSIAYDTSRIWTFPYMILFLGFWILSVKTGKLEQTEPEQPSVWETIFFMVAFLFVSLIPNQLFDGETERLPFEVKLFLILPILLMLYFLKKSSTQK